jgi:hypothetical protein
VLDAVAAKQNYETPMIKSMVTQFRQFSDVSKNDPELATAFATVNKRLAVRQQKLAEDVHAQLKPVTHTIEVIPVR